MFFNSVVFGIFFFIVFYLYWLFFKKNVNARNVFLIIVSYVFYGWWDWRFLSLIIISSAVDFIVGHKMHFSKDAKRRKYLLILSLCLNLGILGFFKYFNFFVGSFVESFSWLGIKLDIATLDIILPVGISFYTFQTLSYTIDIYYRRMEPTPNVFAFFAFVSFFPQLVAGPIERAKDLLPQFYTPKTFDYDAFRSGLLLMLWGFLKKIVIADRLAVYVDSVYGNLDGSAGLSMWLAVLFFAFQLYLDFSAYSDIAIGIARTMGFRLSANFERPYLSLSFSDFWKRWHISLSSWFRDYLYIPLGGNRVSKIKVYRNIMLVFFLSGLWHGASWNFVIWGGLNGLFILVFDTVVPSGKNVLTRIYSAFFVTACWALSLVFFRAPSFAGAMQVFKGLFDPAGQGIASWGMSLLEVKFTLGLLVVLMAIEIMMETKDKLYETFVSKIFVVRWFVYVAMLVAILLFGAYGAGLNDSNFIYFQF